MWVGDVDKCGAHIQCVHSFSPASAGSEDGTLLVPLKSGTPCQKGSIIRAHIVYVLGGWKKAFLN